jgi:hypothetical protein
MAQGDGVKVGRRKLLGVLAAGATAASALPLTAPVRADTETEDEKRKPRYRETDHVKTFYRVNRY